MVWKVHQPKLGRYYPPAPLEHVFVFLPVRPSGLQERRASFACGEVRLPLWCTLQHHLDEVKQQQKLENLPCHCREETIKDTKITVSIGILQATVFGT